MMFVPSKKTYKLSFLASFIPFIHFFNIKCLADDLEGDGEGTGLKNNNFINLPFSNQSPFHTLQFVPNRQYDSHDYHLSNSF